MKNNLLKKMFFAAIMFTGSVIFAQTITGTISDANGPLPGANIVVKGNLTLWSITLWSCNNIVVRSCNIAISWSRPLRLELSDCL